MTITLNGTLTVDCGKGILFAVELHRIHESMVEHMLTRGFKPCLQDVHAGVTLESCNGNEAEQRDKSRAMVQKYVESCYDGTARIRGTRRESTSDPMSRFRTAALRGLWEAKHGKGSWAKLSKQDDAGEIIAKLMEKNADKIETRANELREEAERAAERAKEMAADLDDGLEL